MAAEEIEKRVHSTNQRHRKMDPKKTHSHTHMPSSPLTRLQKKKQLKNKRVREKCAGSPYNELLRTGIRAHTHKIAAKFNSVFFVRAFRAVELVRFVFSTVHSAERKNAPSDDDSMAHFHLAIPVPSRSVFASLSSFSIFSLRSHCNDTNWCTS